MVRQIKRKWRRFYRTHREGCELVGDFIGAVSIFVVLFELYIIGVMLVRLLILQRIMIFHVYRSQ